MRTKEQRMEVAKTIVQQIGNQALWLIGAKNIIATDTGITFKIMRHPEYNTISIDLTSMDDYTMKFTKWHNMRKVREVVVDGIFFDELAQTITEKTGLATRMPKITQG